MTEPNEQYTSLTDPEGMLRIIDDGDTPPVVQVFDGVEMPSGLSTAEAYAVLTGRSVDEVQAALTAAATTYDDGDKPDGDDDSDADVAAEQTGGMVALIPSEADAMRLAIAGGEAVEELHLTLCFLGDAASWDMAQRVNLLTSLSEAFELTPQVTGSAFGAAIWNPDGSSPATVLNVSDYRDDAGTDETAGSPAIGLCLCEVQRRVYSALSTLGYNMDDNYEPWSPHVTLAYSKMPSVLVDALTRVGPITFDRIRLAFAGDFTDLPLYASGSLTAGGEMTTESLSVDAPPVTGQAPVGNTDLPATVGPVPQTPMAANTTSWWGVLVVEGVPTGDGRQFAPGSLTWADLPLPVRWAPEDFGEHAGAVDVGRIDTIWRDPQNPNVIYGAGEMDAGGPNGLEAMRQMNANILRGNSVDVDSINDADVEMIFPEGDNAGGEDDLMDLFAAPELMIFNNGRIRATTLVSIPAFTEAKVAMGLPPQETMAIPTMAPGPTGAGMYDVNTVFPHACSDAQCDLNAVSAAIREVMTSARTDLTLAARTQIHAHMAGHLATMSLVTPPFSFDGMTEEVQALYASGGVIGNDPATAPPDWAFDEPDFDEPHPLEILQADGGWQVVRGHAALWGTCHLSFPDVCVTAPVEQDHSYYRLGEVITASGKHVAVGSIVMNTGHAPTFGLDPRKVAAHYDDTGTVVAMVASGNDDHGLWVSGVIKPGMPPGRVMELAAAKLSGDWRRFGGQLRLVAMLAVNTPGFPVPRLQTHVTNGRQLSLVAAGILPSDAAVAAAEARQARHAIMKRFARQIGRDPQTKMNELRARMGRN